MNPHSFSRGGYIGGSQSASLDRLIHDGNFRASVPPGDFPSFGVAVSNKETSQDRQSVDRSMGASGTKRGSRACVACRKGKNRCESDPSGSQSCRRCLLNNVQCVFEKAERREARGRTEGLAELNGEAENRVSSLEKSVQALASGQSQIQAALQQILAMLPGGATPGSLIPLSDSSITPMATLFSTSATPPSVFSNTSPAATLQMPKVAKSPQNTASGRRSNGQPVAPTVFPKLPGFAPPDHRFGTYGIIPLSSAPPSPSHSRRSSTSSVAHSESDDAAVPLVAPIQALHTLANAADQATALAEGAPRDEESDRDVGPRKRPRLAPAGNVHLRVKKQTKPDPTPRNPFPDVVTKGLVTDTEARELWDIFFNGCHYFVPLWDKTYDEYESYIERTPFSTNGLLAVAAKIRAGNGPLGQTFHRCLEEGQGIARSTLFGPIVRKEAVMAMLILSVWSQYGWLPVGHALRMGLDMNLHRALDKLADPESRSDAEERELVVSARIWMNCYLHENMSSLGNGKPLMLRDNSSVREARVMLCGVALLNAYGSSHPMASETDASLVARIELVNIRIQVMEQLNPLHGKADSSTISFVHKIFDDLQRWYADWRAIHLARYDEDSVLVRLLEVELVYAQLWTVCVALRGCQWDKLDAEQQRLAFQAKDAAMRCVQIYLHSRTFRSHLKYATHDQLATVAFAAVFLLKIAMLFPNSLSLPTLSSNVAEIVHVLSSECFAERYALTLKLMLSNFRRKTGAISTVPGTPRAGEETSLAEYDGLQSFLSLPQMGEGLPDGNEAWPLFSGGTDGFAWPTQFSPSNLPSWLQDNSFTDLGLPADGSDSLFLPLELANMFLPSGTASSATYQFALPDSSDVGAEAW